MKVLFLDVDGVLNHWGSKTYLALSKPKIRLLRWIVHETDCKIVVSSTWRKLDETRRKLKRVLGYHGLEIYSWTTTRYWKLGQMRGEEVDLWLSEHSNIENYVILDDDGDFLDSQMDHFVQTNGNVGLTEKNAERAIQILKG